MNMTKDRCPNCGKSLEGVIVKDHRGNALHSILGALKMEGGDFFLSLEINCGYCDWDQIYETEFEAVD